MSAAPSSWLLRHLHLIHQGEVLDLASGAGRNCAALKEAGHRVLALDRDPELLAVAARLGVSTLCLDLEASTMVWPFEACRFSGIVICNYLHRPLFPRILASLADGGVLIMETFGQGNEVFGRPRSPQFLLAPDELLGLSQYAPKDQLRIVAYEAGYVERPAPAIVQRVVLQKGAGKPAFLREIH